MIDLYLLEELVAFQENGTLAKTADALNVTQPTVTRGLQKLEDELGVQLFNREPNRISLTKAGKFAAKKAKEVITVNQNYAQEVKNFDASQNTITLASNAPGPLIILNNLKTKNVKTDDNLLLESDYQSLLLNEQYTCLILNSPIENNNISSIYLGKENLFVHLNEFTQLASKKEVSFSELSNLTFLVISDIGIWKQIIQSEIPDAKFLYQNDSTSFTEIRNNSIFPYFTTNITKLSSFHSGQELRDRVQIAIKDKSAQQTFYACFLKKNKNRLLPLIEQIQDKWEEID